MHLKFFAASISILFLGFLPGIKGLVIIENSIASEPVLYRRNPQLTVESYGAGGGSGGGYSSTKLRMTGNPNGNSMNGLDVQSNASGNGNENGAAGYSSTLLNLTTRPNDDTSGQDGTNDLDLQTSATGVGSGPNGVGSGTTSLHTKDDQTGESLDVQSTGTGAGEDGGIGLSSLSLHSDDSENGGNEINSTALGIGKGDNATGVSNTKLRTTDDDSTLETESTGVGFGSGDHGTGSAASSLHAEDKGNGETVDTHSAAVGTGDEGGVGLTSSTLEQEDANGLKTKVDTTSVGEGEGDDSLGASQTTLQADRDNYETQLPNHTSPVENEKENATNGSNEIGLSKNGLQIVDEDEGNINLEIAAIGSGDGTGASKIGLQMEDASSKGLNVQTTSEAIGDSSQGIGGSTTTVLVDDQANERSVDARSVGIGINNDEGSGGLTADYLKYQDTDREHQEIVDTSNGGTSTTVTDETSHVDVENASTDYHMVSDDGTTTKSSKSSSTRTSQTSTVQKQSFYTTQGTVIQGENVENDNLDEEYVNQNQGTIVSVPQVVDNDQDSVIPNEEIIQATDNNQSTLISDHQSSQQVINQDTDYSESNHAVLQTENFDQNTFISDSDQQSSQQIVNRDYDYTLSDNQSGQQIVNYNQDSFVSDRQSSQQVTSQDYDYTSSNNQNGHQIVSYNENSSVSNQQSSQQIIHHDQDYILSGDEDSQQVVNYNEDGFVSNQHSSQQVINESSQHTENVLTSNQQSSQQIIHHDQDYILSGDEDSQQVVNYNEDGFVSNQHSSQQVINESSQHTENVLTSNQQSSQQIIHHDQDYILSGDEDSQQVVNYNEDGFVSNQHSSQQVINESSQHTENVLTSNQQSQQDYVVSIPQDENSNLTPSQQFTIGPRYIDSSPPVKRPSLLCPDNNRGPGVVCYYQVSSLFEYADGFILRPDAIDTKYCDVLVVSYAVLNADELQIGAYSPDEERIFGELVKLKNDNLKIILQLQYVAFYEEYVRVLRCENSVNHFISGILNYLKQWGFDGIELPLMAPQLNSNNIYASARIVKKKYPFFVRNLKSQLQQEGLLLSICLPNDPYVIDMGYDIPKLVEYVDWFSVNTIDYNGPNQRVLQFSSPLTPQTIDNPYCIDYTINSLIDQRHVPTDKIVLNVALYGSTYVLYDYKQKAYGAKVVARGPSGPSSRTEGFLTISELCSLHRINWLNNPAIVTDYDDVPTLVLKATYARSKCLGGVAIHAITMDDPSGHLCKSGLMPFTRAISLAYNPQRYAILDAYEDNNDLVIVNYIDKRTTNKYEL